MNFNKLTVKAQEAIAEAQNLARGAGNPELTAEHLLLALMRQEGGIVTPILYDSPLAPQAFDPDMVRAGMTDMQPLRRAGEGSDIAGAALWLASDDSSFVTGQAIQVDGGFTVQVRSGR